jgi:putative CocE/NonD family hydrolase
MSYRYDPMNAPGLRFDVSTNWEPGIVLDDLDTQDGVLAWTTQPLETDLTVRGRPEMELWAATDGDDTEWHVKVADLEPDGRLLQVTWGCLRASYSEDEQNPQPVTPGEVRRYQVELTSAFHTFKAGHRVRIFVASADYPFFARSMNRFGHLVDQDDPRVATNTIHFGPAHPSRLKLAVEATR